MQAIKLRSASLQDAGLLLAWRNDPRTREASHNCDEIALPAHLAWLTAVLADPARQIFIAEADGGLLGSLRVDREADGVSVLSWTVAPAARGQGAGKRMLAALLDIVQGDVRAEVKQGNVASMRIAESAGLTLVREEDGVLHYFKSGRHRTSAG